MRKSSLYSIGHGSRKAEDFLSLLLAYDIKYLADVRSYPFSRFHPQFNSKKLDEFLAEAGITYVFMGNELGGRPKDPSCYDGEGKIDYGLVRKKDFFLSGIERLKAANDKQVSLAVMCSERDPAMCHRSRLIGAVLQEQGIELLHIDEHGKLKDQTSLKLKNSPGTDLFS
jgi:uncharacterized protein (DUF488 family)